MSIEIVERIALKVRLAFESVSKSKTLSGWCFRAAPVLLTAAQKVGLPSFGIAANSGHVFNYYDGHVVDITASQFKDFKDTNVFIKRIPLNSLEQYSRYHAVRIGPLTSLTDFWSKSTWHNSMYSQDITKLKKICDVL